MNKMQISPIAIIRTPFSSKFGIPRQSGLIEDVEGIIVFTQEYRRDEMIRGLEDFDYLWLIWGFSENAGKWTPTVRPPRLGGNRNVGVFASRSPFRPNSLGLSSVKIKSIEDSKDGKIIKVSGVDLMDGTPIYDIKPYVVYSDSHPNARSGFVDNNDWKPLEVVFPDYMKTRFKSLLSKDFTEVDIDKEVDTLIQVLALDPRPHYHKDENRVYGMPYKNVDVKFKVFDNGVLEIVNLVVLE